MKDRQRPSTSPKSPIIASAPNKKEPKETFPVILGSVILLLMCGGWISSLVDGDDDPSPTTTAKAPPAAQSRPASRPPSTQPMEAPDLPAPVPSTAWDRILAEGNPDDRLSAAEAGLAEAYIPDRGDDNWGEPHERWMRRDMAAFLLRIRAEDAALADHLGWQLQAVPPAWCSLVLPTRTPAQLDRQVSAANARGAAFARTLKVDWRPPVPAAKTRLLRFAREEAARRFCPAQARIPGRRVPGPAAPITRVPGGGNDRIQDTALPVFASSTPFSSAQHISSRDLRVAYVELLVGLPDMTRSLPWPLAIWCSDLDLHANVQTPAELARYADTLREIRADRRKKEVAAADLARHVFNLTESRASCPT